MKSLLADELLTPAAPAAALHGERRRGEEREEGRRREEKRRQGKGRREEEGKEEK